MTSFQMLMMLLGVMCLIIGLLVACVWAVARAYRRCQEKKVNETIARWEER
jgi:threonine/homoserine/homoserine lactone efflux protein